MRGLAGALNSATHGGFSDSPDPSLVSSGSPKAVYENGTRLSNHFFKHNRIESGQSLDDGFKDAGPGVDPSLASNCVTLDRRRDGALERFVERCRKKLRKAKDEATQAMVVALLVSDTCGRSGTHASDLVRKHTRIINDSTRNKSGEVLLGEFLGDHVTGAERRGKHPPTGAALAPHRAMLFKAVMDWLGLLDCSLERRPAAAGEHLSSVLHAATWNVVHIGQSMYIVDVLFDPGALYEENSAKAAGYHQLLKDAENVDSTQKGSPPKPPSASKELGGHMPRPPWHVEPWELEINRGDRIGRGGFGEVFHGRWAGVHVAVKEIKDTTPTDADVVDFILEIALLSQLNHPNIVRFWRGCTEVHGGTRSLLMVTEYVKQGGLSRLLHGHGGAALPEPLTLSQALSFGLDIARGVQYLHSQRILHLDLKSPNVLCAAAWTAKLCDFGLAKIRGEQTIVQSTLQGVSPVWAPPEMFDERAGGLTEKADVYSFAVIFFELLTKRVPFQEISSAQLPAMKAVGTLPQIPSAVPADCATLVRQCCALKLNSRPSMSGVVARVREIAQAHSINLSEVKAPAMLLRCEDGQEQRVREMEDAAAHKLVQLDSERAHLRTELDELQRQIEEVRRKVVQFPGVRDACHIQTPGQPDVGRDADDSWCEPFVQEVAGAKFRCALCSKLFRGPEFVRRHVLAKHQHDMRRIAEDAYFDCDVSNEDSMPIHRSMPMREAVGAQRPQAPVMEGHFSQALQDAAESGDSEQVVSLLDASTDPTQQDDGGISPLILAARGGHTHTMEVLLSAVQARGADRLRVVSHATGAGLTAVHAAAAEGHCQVLTMLLRLQASVDATCAQGKTPLLHAGENGHGEACALLIKANADATSRTPDGESLLHVVARFGDADLIAQVVSWRADLLAQDRDGWTPLHEAAHWGAAAVEALCVANANVQVKSKDGETPLHVAVEGYEQTGSCEVLLRFQADVRAADVDGESPLHVAVRRNSIESCRVLLQGGADVNATDHSGRRPLDLARYEDIRDLLYSFGAKEGRPVQPT